MQSQTWRKDRVLMKPIINSHITSEFSRKILVGQIYKIGFPMSYAIKRDLKLKLIERLKNSQL
jgi:hypothetical protein